MENKYDVGDKYLTSLELMTGERDIPQREVEDDEDLYTGDED